MATLLLLLVVREPPRGTQSDSGARKSEEEKETNFTEGSRVAGETVGVSSEVLVDKSTKSSQKDVVKSLAKPPVLCLAFAACLRHTGKECGKAVWVTRELEIRRWAFLLIFIHLLFFFLFYMYLHIFMWFPSLFSSFSCYCCS